MSALNRSSIFVFLIACLLAFTSARAQELSDQALAKIRFDPVPGSQISSGLMFRDETGKPVRLGDYFGKRPVILVLGYYRCPMLCSITLNSMVESLEDLKWSVGNEFDIVNVSIDPRETPDVAAGKKRSYVKRYGRSGAEAGWHFLTGNEAAIQQLAREAGFVYAFDTASGQFAHASGLVILTSKGKISGYLPGVTYPPTEFYAALEHASTGTVTSSIRKFVLLCFHYNPITGRFGAAVMLSVRVLAVLTLAGLAWFVMAQLRGEKSK